MNNNNTATDNVKATLVAHSGAIPVTRQELALLPTPKRTHSHVPIPHIELVERLEKTLGRMRLHIEEEQFAVQKEGGMKLFGTFKLSYEVTINRPATQGYRFAIGLRTANDKTMAVQMCAGANVFVCDNMAFHGSMVTLKRKHTSHIDIQAELEGGVQRALGQFKEIRYGIDRLQGIEVADDHAKALIVDAACSGVMPLRLIPGVVKNYFEPPHEEFRARNMWSLHNAFTESFKGLGAGVGMQAGIELGKMFGM